MKRLVFVLGLVAVLLALPVSCVGQEPTTIDTVNILSDRQLRQRLMFARFQAENQGTSNRLLIQHLDVEIAAVHSRIVRDSTRECRANPNSRNCRPTNPPPDTTPPLPPDTTTTPPQDTVVVPGPEDPPTGEVFTDTLRGVRDGDVVCADGHSCLVGVLEIRRGSLRTVNGTLVWRDGSKLTLSGGLASEYVGGGMYWTPELANDFGVWVGGPNATGRLDIACTPKTAWNRTGSASDWSSTDELWIAPTEARDFAPRRYTLGAPVPRAGPLVPPAEVVNVTRGCSIEGTGHIHIHSDAPQRIENVRLDGLGIPGVLGRYCLHEHMSGDGSRGSVIRGVAIVGCQSKAFVPHSSHGITMVDNVSVNSAEESVWWDQGHATNDLLIDRHVALGVGSDGTHAAYSLACGINMEIRNSVAAGVRGQSSLAVGFDWPEPTSGFAGCPPANMVWTFNAGNVAHNNEGPGIRFWTNTQEAHVVRDYVSYRNKIAGIENGAYLAGTEYYDITSFEDGYQGGAGVNDAAGFFGQASATPNTAGGRARLTGCNITSLDGPAYKVGHRQLAEGTLPFLVEDCTFTANGNPRTVDVPLDKWPLVWVHFGENPYYAHFVRTNVLPEDIVFENDPENNGSIVDIDHADGRRWRVTFENGQKVVTVR